MTRLVFGIHGMPTRNDEGEQVGMLATQGVQFRLGNRLAPLAGKEYLIGSLLRSVVDADRISAEEAAPLLEGRTVNQAIRGWVINKANFVREGGKNHLRRIVDRAGKPAEEVVTIFKPGYGPSKGPRRRMVYLPIHKLFEAFLDGSGGVSRWKDYRRKNGKVVSETRFMFQSIANTDGGMGAMQQQRLIAVIEPQFEQHGKQCVLIRPGEVYIFEEADGPYPDEGYGYVKALWAAFDWLHTDGGLVEFISRQHGLVEGQGAGSEIIVDEDDEAPVTVTTETAATPVAPIESASSTDDGGDDKKGKKKGDGKSKAEKASARRKAKKAAKAKAGASAEA